MHILKTSAVCTAVLLALSACGGGSDNSNAKPTTPVNSAPVATNVTTTGAKAWLPVSGKFAATDPNYDMLEIKNITQDGKTITPVNGTYQLSNALLTINGMNFTLVPLSVDDVKFGYSVSDGQAESSATVSVQGIIGDPLLKHQWHLRNTGQKAHALSEGLYEYLLEDAIAAGMTEADAKKLVDARFAEWEKVLVPGEDMNVISAYQQGVTGQNTIAVVVDSGLEIAHEDLQANVLPNRSLNFVAGALNPTDPTNAALDGDHGTSVAGLIAAVGWNGKGGQGVSPETKLIGMNYLEEQSDLAAFLSHGAPGSGIGSNEPVAVFNRSYGITYPTFISYDEIEEELHSFTALELRGGKGAVNTKSSGNSFRSGSSSLEGNFCAASGARAAGLSCYNANMESSQATPYYFGVGAVNSDGKHTSYSTAGASLLVSAPAGEYGDTAPAMVTTDQMTCLRGYASFPSADLYDEFFGPGYFEAVYPFNNPGHDENLSCNYTNTFNGTSSAAPNTAGVVSLILSANPALTYRDVRHILASTSTKVDPQNAAVKLNTADGEFVAHPGWVKNKAGFEHNNMFGFGRVNAGKAVEMAKNYKVNLGEAKFSEWIGVGEYAAEPVKLSNNAVPDNSAKGVEFTIDVADNIKLEGAQFRFSVANPEMVLSSGQFNSTAGADLAIEVTSPAGTRSVLLSSKQALLLPAVGAQWYTGYILKDSVFLSNAFYGESAKGSWKFKVLDVNANNINMTGGVLNTRGLLNNKVLSTVEGVSIRVFGH